MKNAGELSKVKYHLLSKEDWRMIEDAIDMICNNHKDELWWKIYVAIDDYVRTYLNYKLGDDYFEEFE